MAVERDQEAAHKDLEDRVLPPFVIATAFLLGDDRATQSQPNTQSTGLESLLLSVAPVCLHLCILQSVLKSLLPVEVPGPSME